MHGIHRTAASVIDNPDQFSDAALRYAKLIDSEFQKHRKNVAYLWKNRRMLRQYRNFYDSSLNLQRIQKSRYAGMMMRNLYDEDQLVPLHQFRVTHRKMHVRLAMESLTLTNILKLERETDIDGAYEYIRLFNAGDSSTQIRMYPHLCYLEGISMKIFVEVLLWKLKKAVTINT